MNILLLVAPSSGALELENSNEIAQNMGFYPPLGIMYIASNLKQKTNHNVSVIDSESERLSYAQIEKRIVEFRPDVVGLTTFTNTLLNVLDVLKIIKKVNHEIITVLGGPHLSLYPDETIGFPEVDFAFNGDGEDVFVEFVNLLEQYSKQIPESELEKLPGIIFRKTDGSIIKNGYARVADIDALPFPDRSFINEDLYFCILGKPKKMTTIMSSRGCPFKCTFCNTPDKQYRYRNAVNVVDEMEYLSKRGVEEIFFFDDLFNINARRGIEICDEILKRGLKVSWAFRGRVAGMNEEFAKKAAEAGCTRIQFGIEKATDEGLLKVRKGAKVKQILNAVNLTKKYGMMCVGNFLLFTPGETEKDVEEIIQFALKLKLDHAEFSVFIPYPGTKIFEDGLKSGFFDKDYWAEYAKNPTKDFHLVWEETTPIDKMYEISNKAHKRFYFRPRIIWNELKATTSLIEFKRKFNGALIILNLKA